MRVSSTLVLLGLILLNASSLYAFDGKNENSIQDSKKITIIIKHIPPYIFEKPKISGLDVEIIDTIFSQMGLELDYNFVPVKRLEMMADKGIGDVFVILNDVYNGCHTSKPFRAWNDGIVVLKDLASKIQTPRDLEGRVIGGFPNSYMTLGPELGEGRNNIKKYVEYNNTKMALTNLLSGRVDVYIGDFWAISYYLSEMGYTKNDNPFAVTFKFKKIPQYLCFKDDKLRGEFDRQLEDFLGTKKFQEIKIKNQVNLFDGVQE